MSKVLDGVKRKKKIPRKINWKIFAVFFGLASIIIFGSLLASNVVRSKLGILKLFRSGKYLIIFQNNAELRPTGGFIGSFAVATFENFKLKNIDLDTNIYKLDKSFSQNHIIPPPSPLSSITSGKWAMRDANWAVSYPESAQQIIWFYKQETGQDVDGVFAINASVVRELLKISGPIYLSGYKTTINYDNFFTELTTQIEEDYFTRKENKIENEPKTILKNLMPEIFKKIKNHKLKVLRLAFQQLSQKQILFFSKNETIEKDILKENWGGEIKKTSSDYLCVNQANIADLNLNSKIGGKSSLSVKEKIDYKVSKEKENLVGNLTVTRSHLGSQKWPDGINYNWTRIFVPQGSILVTAKMNGKDFKKNIVTDIESGKTTFGFWTQTSPKKSTIINLTYTLPISKKNYSLLVQKQPGNLGDELNVTFENKVLFDGILSKDLFLK